ncbi:SAM-dependent chlorinase/fluorinase [uncultured Microscilla sp.]|uniref:SAM hydrolase/SAM-dependent halogenase family protein n=1 Tax=uncultured Microscilla sp. TaxID=432653 RepID=UPI0026337727|nr:SAM-dependent chlorinase/fluorinase [uncultured Microscilla sp.]
MNALVLMTDFGLRDRFVASMKGVALGINPALPIIDLTHEIAPFNIWEASQTLAHTIPYWSPGTVFVAVIDPGVGTKRRSVVALTNNDHLIVTPDNGTLTLVAQEQGIKNVYLIDEAIHRRPGSDSFHTFHGRDVYVYVGALLASGKLRLDDVGKKHIKPLIQLHIPEAEILPDAGLKGIITKIEHPYGNIVTNIPYSWIDALGASVDQKSMLQVRVWHKETPVFAETLGIVKSFGFKSAGTPLLYQDSQGNLGLAINQGDFAKVYGMGSGTDWRIETHQVISGS